MVSVGALLAWRWDAIGAVLIALAAAGLGILAAIEYVPMVAVAMTLALLLLSMLLGLLVGVGSRSMVVILRSLSRGYVELIRGTPLLVQILIFFYVVANSLGVQNRYVVGVLIMALFSGAYVSEIVRAGMMIVIFF